MDWTTCVWFLFSTERLLDPFNHVSSVAAASFSTDGRFISQATAALPGVRHFSDLYESEQPPELLLHNLNVPIQVYSLSPSHG